MTMLLTAVRRSLLLVLFAAAVGATYAWLRDRDQNGLAPAEWPPIAPEARSAPGGSAGWIEPGDDGSCPLDHPVKANDNSGIFHVPGGRFYDRTKAERCYSDEERAVADGYRRAKN